MTAKKKTSYRVTVPETGEVIRFSSTMEINFAALVFFTPYRATEPGWYLVKKSKTEKGASYIGQTKQHNEYLKSFPHVIVPVETVGKGKNHDEIVQLRAFAEETNGRIEELARRHAHHQRQAELIAHEMNEMEEARAEALRDAAHLELCDKLGT